MSRHELSPARVKGTASRLVDIAGEKFRALDRDKPHPRSTEELEWDRFLRMQWGPISEEWHAFRSAGGRLPLIENLIGQWLGNTGAWEGGVLVAWGLTSTALAQHFPVTLGALARIPGLRSALWSVLAPGAEIPEHRGPNPGVLRFHLGVDCPEGAALGLESKSVPFRNGETVLFDDTEPHSSANRSDRERVTLFCEVLRPLPTPWKQLNKATQDLLAIRPQSRARLSRANAWNIALNPHLTAPA